MAHLLRSVILTIAAVSAGTLAAAQPSSQPSPPPAASPRTTSSPAPGVSPRQPAAPTIEPDAVAALGRMSAYLKSLKAFVVRARATTDEVLDTGQKIQLDSVVDIRARPPDRLRADVTSERKQRTFYYDGRTLTVFAPRVKYYATVAAPPTIVELLDVAEQKYGIDMPLTDLFHWGTERAPAGALIGAIDVGPAQVDGAECEQYAFRQGDVDWQVWIQKGADPVPRKLVITTTQDPAQPQHVAILAWDVAPSLDESSFAFVPPADATRIVIKETTAAPDGGSSAPGGRN
jgi:hypothetical protein